MSKLWTIGRRLLVLGMVFLIVSVVGHLVAIGCLLWWPSEVQELLLHVFGTMVFAMVLSVAGYVMARVSEK